MRISRVAPLLGSLILYVTTASALDFVNTYQPYLGIDVAQRDLQMYSGYGRGNFQKRLKEYNAFLGIMLNKQIGLEVGQSISEKASKTTLTDPGLHFGTEQQLIYSQTNYVDTQGTNLNLIAQYPFNQTGIALLGSLGANILKMTARTVPSAVIDPDTLDAVIFTPVEQQEGIRNYSSRKVIFRAGLGASYQIHEAVKLRLLAHYENTHKFKSMAAKTLDGKKSTNRISFKDNFSYGLGIVFTPKF